MDDIQDEFKDKKDDMDDSFHEAKGRTEQKIEDATDDE